MSAIYSTAKALLLTAGIDLENDAVSALLIDGDSYAFDPLDAFLSDIPVPARVGVATPLTGRTVNIPGPGVLDANDVTIPSVVGPEVDAVLLFKDTGVAGTSPLIAYVDGVNVTPNGGNIVIAWDDGPDRIFRL